MFPLLFVFTVTFASVLAKGPENNIVSWVGSDKRSKIYKPEWADLDTRQLPEWFDKAKIGIFIHWGVYAVPSFGSEWFWFNWKQNCSMSNTDYAYCQSIKDFMKKNYPPDFTYQEFAPKFKAEFYDPGEWASLFRRSGAKYVVLTSKHHEGYTLFPSKRSFSWNSVEVGPHRDLVGELAEAVRKMGLEFGLYHSLYEWFNPMYLEDKGNNFTTYSYRTNKLWPDFKQIVNSYKPSIIWSDGDWEAPDVYWNSTLLLAWLYNESPVKDHIVVNDRWGIDIPCHHGDYYNCKDRYNPGVLQKHKWENAFTLDHVSWGYRRHMQLRDVMTINKLLLTVVQTVSCGGNALINVGATSEGTIMPIFQERLWELGTWLELNGEAIYNTSPWLHQNDTINPHVWYTCTKREYNALNPTQVPQESDHILAIYAIVLKWPRKGVLMVKDLTPVLHTGVYKVELIDHNLKVLEWKIVDGEVNIQLPDKATVSSKYAFTLKISSK